MGRAPAALFVSKLDLNYGRSMKNARAELAPVNSVWGKCNRAGANLGFRLPQRQSGVFSREKRMYQ
jgi:hypothetical protein